MDKIEKNFHTVIDTTKRQFCLINYNATVTKKKNYIYCKYMDLKKYIMRQYFYNMIEK